jgi:hypothetical protein
MSASTRFNNDLRYRDSDHPAQTAFTPEYVLRPVADDLGGDPFAAIGLDPCTTPENPVDASVSYTIEDDGLVQPWQGPGWFPSIFCNPPYGKAREPWIERCIAASGFEQKVILLIPAATDTRIFRRAVETSTAVVFIQGRVKFGVLRPNRRQVAASHPSALIGWNTGLKACSSLGWRAFVK